MAKKRSDPKKKMRIALNVVLVMGILIATFLIYEHFSPSASEFCSFGANLDCGVVNKSPYANLDGIFYLMVIDFGWNFVPLFDLAGINAVFDFLTSNAFLGALTLLLVLLLNTKYKNKDFLWISKEKNADWVFGILAFGVIYGFYLFLIQHFILKTYCIFCLGLDVTLVVSAILAWKLR